MFSLRGFAFALYRLERYSQSLDCLNRVIEIAQPSEDVALHPNADSEEGQLGKDFFFLNFAIKGNVLFSLERYLESVASYDKAIEFKPDDHITWSNQGNSLDNLQKYDEAIASYDKAIEFKPDDHVAWSNRGFVLQKLGHYDNAIISYDQALKIEPENFNALYRTHLRSSSQLIV